MVFLFLLLFLSLCLFVCLFFERESTNGGGETERENLKQALCPVQGPVQVLVSRP